MKNRVLNINQMVHLKELGVDTSKASMVIIARDEYGDEIEWSNLSYKKDTDTFMYDSWDDDSDQPSPKEAYLEYLNAEDGEYDHSYRKENGTFILQDILELLPSRIEKDDFSYGLFIEYDGYDINKWSARYVNLLDGNEKDITNENILQAAYEMLCWCAKEGYLK